MKYLTGKSQVAIQNKFCLPTMWTALIAIALLIGLLVFAAQLQLSLRITRAKTDVPVFNQIFVLCLVFSGRIDHFYWTRVRSLVMLVSNSLTHWLTHSLLFSKLDWCDPGVWRCQLKTCWGCFCCGCWSWESCWQLLLQIWGLRFDHKAKKIFSWSQARSWSWTLVSFCRWYFVEVMKFNLGRNTEARFWSIFWILSLV